jgi:Spy/CpxP family protein refolding chaperone
VKTLKAVMGAALALLVLMPGLALAQPVQTPPTVGGAKSGESACFQRAGVSDSVWQQVHAIRQNTHQQVTAICQNASLTPDQRHQQIKQVHALAKRQIDGLLTPQQLAGIKSCRAEHRGERTGGGKAGAGGHGDVCAKAGGRAK